MFCTFPNRTEWIMSCKWCWVPDKRAGIAGGGNSMAQNRHVRCELEYGPYVMRKKTMWTSWYRCFEKKKKLTTSTTPYNPVIFPWYSHKNSWLYTPTPVISRPSAASLARPFFPCHWIHPHLMKCDPRQKKIRCLVPSPKISMKWMKYMISGLVSIMF